MFFDVTNLAVDGDRHCGTVTDNQNPVFSWAAEHSENGRHQSAYHVKVRTVEKVKWDSGWVQDGRQFATYAGEMLKTGEQLFWSVQIKDDAGNESTTGTHDFVMALMEPWKAPWITTPLDAIGEAKYFRKCLDVKKAVRKAFLYVCGIGYHHVTLNGRQIDDAYLQPAISNYKKHCYYVTLPVTEDLRLGQNELEIVVGEGWRRNYGEYTEVMSREVEFFGVPKLTAQLNIEYIDGTVEGIVTDESWRCGRGPVVFNHLFDGETYDERVKTEYTQNAVLVTEDAPEMKAQTIRPILRQEIYHPVMKTRVDGGYIFDFGTNIAGVVEVTIPGDMPAGTEVKIYHVENITPDGEKDPETLREAKATDTFISGGVSAMRKWTPRFVYHGFRYIYVEGWHGIPKEENFTAIALYTDVKNQSYFRCGSPIVNQLQNCIVQTEKNNLHSISTDCPQRDERMGWLNDATVRYEEICYNFDMYRLFSKIIDDIVAEQGVDGSITDTAPYVYGERPADPVCSSFLIAALQNYLHNGRTDDIRKHYKDFKAWNDCLRANSEGGIVNYSYYGDWAGPADCCVTKEVPHSVMTPGLLMSTGYHYYNYKLLERFARILGDEKEVEANRLEAERVREAFLKKWWNEESGKVDTGAPGSQAFALWLGILPEESRKLAAKVMHDGLAEKGYRILMGNLNTKYVMEMLTEYGYIDAAWKLITRETYPSWGFMLQNGATTIWERFEFKRGSGMNSHDHPMYGAIGNWFYSHIAGVKPGCDGWQEFVVRPYLPADLLYAEAGVETPLGMIYLKWQKQLGCTDLLLSVPFGTTAKVMLPWGEEAVVGSGYHNFHKQEETA